MRVLPMPGSPTNSTSLPGAVDRLREAGVEPLHFQIATDERSARRHVQMHTNVGAWKSRVPDASATMFTGAEQCSLDRERPRRAAAARSP